MKKFLTYVWLALKVAFVAIFLFTVSLFFREQRLPSFAVDKIVEGISSPDFYLKCDGASFGFRHGINLSGVRLYDVKNDDIHVKPLVSANYIHLNFFTRTIRVIDATYKRLPSEYYIEDEPNKEAPLSGVGRIDLPDVEPFRIVFESPDILGLTPDEVSASISVRSGKLLATDIKIDLSGSDAATKLFGEVCFDFALMKLRANVSGNAKQSQIRPFLEVLDIPCSYPYVDAFTQLPTPVPSKLEVDADLITGDLVLWMHYSPNMGKYRSVPMVSADGDVFFYTRKGEEPRKVALKVNLSNAVDSEGRMLKGWLTVDDFSGRYRLNYDVTSTLRFEDALVISEILDPSDFSFIKCTDAPYITLKGKSGVSADDLDAVDLGGIARLGRGEVLGFAMRNLDGKYSLKRDVFSISGKFGGKTGGEVDFSTDVFLEGFESSKARFAVKGNYRNGSLEELADVFSFDLGDRKGQVDWDMELSGKLSGQDVVKSCNGKGRIVVRNGHLARMKLFSRLTGILADKVPGISFLVDQTEASADYTIKDGVLRSENVYIEGGFVSIKAWGEYDMVKDNLDFVARVQIMKKESLIAKIIHPVTYPVTKLFLEFKVTGPIDNPNWENIQILDRLDKIF